MNFFKKIPKSIYSPEFYAAVAKSSFGAALGYFLLFTLLITLVQTLFSAPNLLVNLPQEATKLLDAAVSSFPANLEVAFKNGEVITNVKEPFFIRGGKGEGIIVIDTKTPYSASQFEKYAADVWVTKDSVFYKDSSGGVKTQSLTQFPDTTLNRTIVSSLAEKVRPYIRYVGPAALIGALLLFYLLYSGRLVYLLFLALLIWILTKIMKKNLSYGQAYKVGLYAVTLGIVIELAATLLHWGGFPFMFTFITLLVVLVNFWPAKKPQTN